MTWRPAGAADLPDLKALLHRHIDGAMFPLGNLEAYGLGGSEPYATRFWINGNAVFGLSNAGMGFPVGAADAPWADLADALAGETLTGIVGLHAPTRAAQRALAPTASIKHDADEPLYALTLSALRMPDCAGYRITPLTDATRARATTWRSAYQIEIMGGDPETAPAQAEAEIGRYIDAGSHRILWQGETPVAMTGVSARAGGQVIVGGVYTPPEARRRGHARRAVALHMRELAQSGIPRAILAAANPAAARAYEAIGFARIGDSSAVQFRAPVQVAPSPVAP